MDHSRMKRFAFRVLGVRDGSVSSLSRSQTMESGIDKLSDLSTLVAEKKNRSKRLNRFCFSEQSKNMIFQTLGVISGQLFELQMLLRPIALASVPFLWRYLKEAGSAQKLWIRTFSFKDLCHLFTGLLLIILVLVGSWLLLVYCSSSGSRAEFLYNIKNKVMTIFLRCSTPQLCYQLFSLISLVPSKRHCRTYPRVIWTIGSKRKPQKEYFGEMVQRFDNEDVYEGEFYLGKSSGCGVYYFYKNGKYEGDWVDGEFDGYGVETWDNGSRYRGQYKHGLRNGYGLYRFQHGDEYSGQWANGQSHGYGVHKCADGSKYIGLFRRGMKHGFGCYYFRNGDTYAGEYFENKLQGYGVYRFVHGHAYEGAWHDGKKEGLGVYTFKNGETCAGLWTCDAFQLPSYTDTSIRFPHDIAVSHTKVLHAVQEARQAAGKALKIPRVSDRVNRAVEAANRAANAARVAAIKAAQKKNQSSVPKVCNV